MNKETFIRENCPDRRGTNCSKWDILSSKYGDPDLISMWVAAEKKNRFRYLWILAHP